MRLKYCDVPEYKDDAFLALESHFKDRDEFEDFYKSLNSDKVKDEFLHISSSYLFFVKNGNWHVDVSRSDAVIEYFSNSFKLVAILSLIESLSKEKHIDFYEWLVIRKNKIQFPIESKEELDKQYLLYKQKYGAIKKCKAFFEELSEQTKSGIFKLIEIDGKCINDITDFVEMLYSSRSEFAHETNISIEIGDWLHFGKHKGKQTLWKKFKLKYLLAVFEEGLFSHFNKYSGKKIHAKSFKADSLVLTV